MSEMPADIIQAAQEAYEQACRHTNQAEIIAMAILAERERCADIIHPFTVQGGVGGMYVRKAAWSILNAVRPQSQPERTTE